LPRGSDAYSGEVPTALFRSVAGLWSAPVNLIVLRPLRQELVSRLTVPTIYSVKSVKNVESFLRLCKHLGNSFREFAMTKPRRLRVVVKRGEMLCRHINRG
jgi:hypothetical protein